LVITIDRMKLSKNLMHRIIDSDNAALTVEQALDGASLKMYAGPQPESPELAPTTDPVIDFGTIRLKHKDGRVMNTESWSGTAVSNEPLGWFRLQGPEAALDGSIAVHGRKQADLIIMNESALGAITVVDHFILDCRIFD